MSYWIYLMCYCIVSYELLGLFDLLLYSVV